MERSIPEQVQKDVFEQGLKYGLILSEELNARQAFAPLTMLSLPFSRLVTPYAPVVFEDYFGSIVTGMRHFINKGTAAYVAELAYGMTHVVGGKFNSPSFKTAMSKLVEDLGGYEPETMLKLVFDIPVTDFISFTYNTDCHWVDYSRKLAFTNIAYSIPSLAAMDAVSIELFPRYRQYSLYRETSDSQSKRVASSVLITNAKIHEIVYRSLGKFRPEYASPEFLDCILEMDKMLVLEANKAMESA